MKQKYFFSLAIFDSTASTNICNDDINRHKVNRLLYLLYVCYVMYYRCLPKQPSPKTASEKKHFSFVVYLFIYDLM
jgi:hypothetical protein